MPDPSSKRQGFKIRVGEREHEVEVGHDAEGRAIVLVDGIEHEVADAGAHAVRVATLTEAGARQLEVTLASHRAQGRADEAWVGGARVPVVVLTEQEARLAAALGKSTTGSGSGSLKAPMPGRVVKILIREGEQVELGAPALIVEAMKMENELHAPASGRVVHIAVAEGDTVEAGQILCEIAAPEPEPSE